MLFNSLHFAVFFVIVFIVFFSIPKKHRWILLLSASYYFYMSWNPKLILLILTTTTITYICGIMISKGRFKKFFLVFSIVSCLGVLLFFKYFNFLAASAFWFFNIVSIPFPKIIKDIVLPVGISFYTFQTLSYVIDVYRGKTQCEKHFGIYALYVSFFPQLVAGPIERPENLIPQLKQEYEFNYDNAVYGAKLMAVGMVKKVVIADTIAKVVNVAYESYAYKPYVVIAATFLFAFQIYCDFSGYSDIAIGCAKILGIDIMRNFKSPYLSKNIREFWSRWHISLSSWFRDYLYIPLGGSRVKVPRYYLNVLITFLVSGLWHGADWTFVLWGFVHGMLLILYDIYSRIAKRIRGGRVAKERKLVNALSTAFTFVLVCLAWIPFRIESFSQLVTFGNELIKTTPDFSMFMLILGSTPTKAVTNLIIYLIMCILLLVFDYYSLKYDLIEMSKKLNKKARWAIYYAVTFLILFMMIYNYTTNATQEFIYFQF